MKKISLQKIGEKLARNLSLLFFAAFLILLIFEAFEINASVQLILKGKQPGPAPKLDKSARINFDSYNEVVSRIQQGDSFKPTGGINRDPFNSGFNPAPAQPSGGAGAAPAPGVNPNDSSGLLKLE